MKPKLIEYCKDKYNLFALNDNYFLLNENVETDNEYRGAECGDGIYIFIKNNVKYITAHYQDNEYYCMISDNIKRVTPGLFVKNYYIYCDDDHLRAIYQPEFNDCTEAEYYALMYDIQCMIKYIKKKQ